MKRKALLVIGLAIACIACSACSAKQTTLNGTKRTLGIVEVVCDDDWTIEDYSTETSTHAALTIGDAKQSDVGLVIEACLGESDITLLTEQYKMTLTEEMSGTEIEYAAQAGENESWAELSGRCIEPSKEEEMNFLIKFQSSDKGTVTSSLMYTDDVPEEVVDESLGIIDSITVLDVDPLDMSDEDVTDKTLEDYTDEELNAMTADQIYQLMKQTFKFVKFNTLSYHDGAYTAISLGEVEPTDATSTRESEGQGIKFKQELRDISELNDEDGNLQYFSDVMRVKLNELQDANEDFYEHGIFQSEDYMQCAAMYSFGGTIYVEVCQVIASDAYMHALIEIDEEGITEDTQQALDELCVLLQITIEPLEE